MAPGNTRVVNLEVHFLKNKIQPKASRGNTSVTHQKLKKTVTATNLAKMSLKNVLSLIGYSFFLLFTFQTDDFQSGDVVFADKLLFVDELTSSNHLFQNVHLKLLK